MSFADSLIQAVPIAVLHSPHPLLTLAWFANTALMQQVGRIHAAAFSDAMLWSELLAKAVFWQQPQFYGVDITSLHQPAVDGYYHAVSMCSNADLKLLCCVLRHGMSSTYVWV